MRQNSWGEKCWKDARRIKSTYARTKLAQGKLEEAKVIVGEAIDSGVAILGVDDPEVLKDYELLAVIIERLGELENAGKVQERALNGYCKHFGELHYQTLAARQNLEEYWQYARIEHEDESAVVM
jgi:Tfp pilus assembly protein PilF